MFETDEPFTMPLLMLLYYLVDHNNFLTKLVMLLVEK